jgi:hypothetical protein
MGKEGQARKWKGRKDREMEAGEEGTGREGTGGPPFTKPIDTPLVPTVQQGYTQTFQPRVQKLKVRALGVRRVFCK